MNVTFPVIVPPAGRAAVTSIAEPASPKTANKRKNFVRMMTPLFTLVHEAGPYDHYRRPCRNYWPADSAPIGFICPWCVFTYSSQTLRDSDCTFGCSVRRK